MSPEFSRHVILGLPASGKTTFLAALWHLIQADEAECQLVLKSLEGDVGYLNKIAEAWRTYSVVGRTSQTGDVDVAMKVTNREGSQTAELRFPDLAGESFDVQVEQRRIKPRFADSFADDTGVLLFIKVDRGEDLTITELNDRLPAELRGGDGDGGAVDAADTVEWDVTMMSVQARIVQVLADLFDPPFNVRPRRLAVILSAWDVLPQPRPEPDYWLASEMPLVDQFLRSNSAMFDVRVYGVSAQGMDLEKDSLDAMPAVAASQRIIVEGHGANAHDLTAPLVWLMMGG